MSGKELKLSNTEIFWRDEISRPASIEILKETGAGRAAAASLVRLRVEDEEPVECVEKRFNPGMLTRSSIGASFNPHSLTSM